MVSQGGVRAGILFTIFAMLLLVAPQAVRAGDDPSVELEQMTWVQVRDRLAAGATTVIIPTGGTEQNGPHMVLGKHNFIVAETARRLAIALGDTLIAPVLAYVPEGAPGSRWGHMAYPGTISLPSETFEAVLVAAATSLKTHGFKTIVLLGDSGGNQASQQRVADVLSKDWASQGVRVLHAGSYYADNGGDAFLLAQGETKAAIGTHAGIRDTSELMAVLPGGVDLAQAVADAEGVTGDPKRASAGWGEELIDLKVAAAVRDIKTAREITTSNTPVETGFWAMLYGWVFG